MKTKMILLAALIGAASMSAQAGVRFGFSFGLPLPVFCPPVVVAAPCAPAPVAVVQAIPACPDVNYVWAPGYWSYRTTGYVWVPRWLAQPPSICRARLFPRRTSLVTAGRADAEFKMTGLNRNPVNFFNLSF